MPKKTYDFIDQNYQPKQDEQEVTNKRKRLAVEAMVRDIWSIPADKGWTGGKLDIHSQSGLFREADGRELERYGTTSESSRFSYFGITQSGLHHVAGFFDHAQADSNLENAKLQILIPGESGVKPHYLTYDAQSNQYQIGEEVPAPQAVAKPTRWQLFKSFFTKVPEVDNYKKYQDKLKTYNDFCAYGTRLQEKVANIKAEKKAAAEKAAQQKREAEMAAQKQKEAEKAAQKQKELDKSAPKNVEKEPEVRYENINEVEALSPNKAIQRDYNAWVDKTVKENPGLKVLGAEAKKGMKEILKSGGRNQFNSEISNAKRNGVTPLMYGMATVTLFNMALEEGLGKDGKKVFDSSRTIQTLVVSNFAKNDKFLRETGYRPNRENDPKFDTSNINPVTVANFIETKGTSIRDSYPEIAKTLGGIEMKNLANKQPEPVRQMENKAPKKDAPVMIKH